jgi:glycosyltransferase involved in cell wall biosynthesis
MIDLLLRDGGSESLIKVLLQSSEVPSARRAMLPLLEDAIVAGQESQVVLGLYLLASDREGWDARFDLASPLRWASGLEWLFGRCDPDDLRAISARLTERFPDFAFLGMLHAILAAVPVAKLPPRLVNDLDSNMLFVASSVPDADSLLVCFCGGARRIGIPLQFFDRWMEPLPAHVLYLRSSTPLRYGDGVPELGASVGETATALRALATAMNVKRLAVLGISGGAYPGLLMGALAGADRIVSLSGLLAGREPGAFVAEIEQALAQSPPTAQALCLFPGNNASDLAAAEALRDAPRVRLVSMPGTSEHNLMPVLALRDHLPGLLGWLIGASKTIPDLGAVPPLQTTSDPILRSEIARAPAGQDAVDRRVMLMIGYLGPGGAERQICYLAQGLADHGWCPSVLAFSLGGDGSHFVPELKAKGIPVQALDQCDWDVLPSDAAGMRRVIRALPVLLRLPDEIRTEVIRAMSLFLRERPELVICYLDRVNIVGGFAAVLAGVPRILLSGRNLNPTHLPYLDRPWFRDLYQVLLHSPNVTLKANSHAGAESYARWLGVPVQAVPVVHNGLSGHSMPDAPDRATAIRQELGLGSDGLLVLGVFRLSPEKRPDVFFDIVERLRQRFPGMVAAVAGLGNAFGQFSNELRLSGRHHYIHLLGKRDDVPALLQASDLMLHVSEAEGAPNAVMEAQWLGCPVVGTRGGGTIEILTHAQRPYFHGQDELDLVFESCVSLLGDAEARQVMGQASRVEARRRFSTTTMVAQTLELAARPTPPSFSIPEGSPVVGAKDWLAVLAYLGRLAVSRARRRAAILVQRFYCRRVKGIWHDRGHCFMAPLPRGLESDQEGRSRLRLLENGVVIGLRRCQHDDIRDLGGGRYSHWGRHIYFSTPDNSDPRTNGRTYNFVLGAVGEES